MRQHIASSTQTFAPLACRAAAERRSDETASDDDRADVGSVVGFLTAAMFGEVMKSLRSALSLR